MTVAAQQMDSRYKDWSKQRRGSAALDKVVKENWTISEAARRYGVDRSHLSKKVKAAKEEHKADLEEAAEEDRKVHPLGLMEERRVPPFWEWERMYFGHLTCPDCGVRHESPPFHHEIIEALEDSELRRVVVNTPPYHSKSTLGTVKHTLYEICRNPNLRTAIVSSSQGLSKDFLGQIGEFLDDPDIYEGAERNLIDDFGPFRHDRRTWNQTALVVGRESTEKDATVSAWGIFQRVYGRRFDRLKFDDIADFENTRNPEQVARMLGNQDTMFLSRIGKSGRAHWFGTRVSANDPYRALGEREGYEIIRYSAIQDEESKLVLWPEHFPWHQVMLHRQELTPAEFALIYQNIDSGGLSASFTQEMMEAARDSSRTIGMFDPSWVLIAGLDPAGASKGSGFTAFVLIGVDTSTGRRHLIDLEAHKAMKAPELKRLMFEWSDRYPISEWRVESNGVQSQLVVYNDEIAVPLAQRGIKVTEHYTNANKIDPVFGVDAMAPLFDPGFLVNFPYGDEPSRRKSDLLAQQLVEHGFGGVDDVKMAFWFAELGVKDLLNSMAMPLYDANMRVPARIRRRRKVVDFGREQVRGIPLDDQRVGALDPHTGRMTYGHPMEHSQVGHRPAPERPKPVNL